MAFEPTPRLPTPRLSKRAVSALREFLRQEAAGGYVLMAAAALALIIANSPWANAYNAVLHFEIGGTIAGLALRESLAHWINDGLMAVFFLLVGLEIKREVLDGQLSKPSHLLLPGVAALGGVAVPALIYSAVNLGTPEHLRGWAIPAATDIAFALGVLSLLGSRVPASLKIFLAAIAILDDLVAILIIAIFYTDQLNGLALVLAGGFTVALIALNRFKVTLLWLYLLLGLALWLCVLKSGIHATLAGVVLAMTIPLRPSRGRPDDPHSPLHQLEHALHKPVAFGIIPLFGLANAGVSFAGMTLATVMAPIPLGVALGLFFGKQAGIFLAAMAVIRLGLADLPLDATVRQLYGVAVLCGIGFTMSLFIGNLAFADPHLLDQVKIGVLGGSVLSAAVGYWLLAGAKSADSPTRSAPMA
ncbi:sodium:proton antiporter [Caulobacter henricii]|uniref:Na(+)/H(+) antiporter NhaA n=1 Tax=Caulobacter henricii TaxID=69395 RepID=A0A0P0P3Y7_9CAUL|nr:sodium:proton antiporter [Caulobacter henricii]